MAQILTSIPLESDKSVSREVLSEDLRPVHRSYQALHFIFTVAPIIAGVDKFFNVATSWQDYLAPIVPRILGVTPTTFMNAAGVIEIFAGIGVLIKPKIFGYVLSIWLVGIILNLLLLGKYYDLALRDLGLAFSAFALSQLATAHEKKLA